MFIWHVIELNVEKVNILTSSFNLQHCKIWQLNEYNKRFWKFQISTSKIYFYNTIGSQEGGVVVGAKKDHVLLFESLVNSY